MRSAALSDVGLVRSRNEDAYWCDGDRGIFIVADGTGTSTGGETAAAIAVEIISTEITLAVDRGLEDLPLADALHDAFREASIEIYKRANEGPDPRDIACSAVAAVITKGECVIAHAGDSRAYLFAEDGLHQITVDDTPVAVMVKRGILLPEKARTHHLKNVLVKNIGSSPEVEANLIRFPIRQKERLVFCSDGLWMPLPDNEIQVIVQRNLDPDTTCYELVEAARGKGGQDNITVLVVEADRPVDRIALLAGKPR